MEKKELGGISFVIIMLYIGIAPALMAFIAGISGTSSGSIALDLFIRIPLIISPILFFTAAVGIVFLKKWACILGISLSLIAALIFFVGAVGSIIHSRSHPEDAYFNIPFAIVCLIFAFLFGRVVYYLTRSKVKEQFK